jgi:uncharacterized membrane protein YkvI
MSDKAFYITQTLMVMVLLMLSMSAAGCDVVEGIFKAGVWVGVIVVILIVALIGWGIRAMRR